MLLTGDARQFPHQRHDCVPGARKTLVEASAVKKLVMRGFGNRVGCLLGDDPEFGLRVGERGFDVEPGLPAVLQPIEGADARVGDARGGGQFVAHDAFLRHSCRIVYQRSLRAGHIKSKRPRSGRRVLAIYRAESSGLRPSWMEASPRHGDGGGSILSDPSPADRPCYQPRIFFSGGRFLKGVGQPPCEGRFNESKNYRYFGYLAARNLTRTNTECSRRKIRVFIF